LKTNVIGILWRAESRRRMRPEAAAFGHRRKQAGMRRLTNLGPSAATRFVRAGAAAIVALALAGCQPIATPTPVPNAVTGENPADVKYYPSDEPVKLGIQRFTEGNFGLAQHYFQDAVEKTPKDATAWVGLAASYDRLGRFDLADRSYAAAVKLVGHTPAILNNEGYSYMLRGDLGKARAKFDAALRLDPGNATAINNLALLNESYRFVERASNGEPCGSVDCVQ
jgi:Tfp pilus assembly protein PilF